MKYLGIDFGLKRIGLAISEGKLASPWQVLEITSFPDALDKIIKVVKEGEFQKIVVGLPEGKMGQTVLGFVKRLKRQGLDVMTADEILSSRRARDQMIMENVSKKKRRIDDAYSAAIILQNYLDNL